MKLVSSSLIADPDFYALLETACANIARVFLPPNVVETAERSGMRFSLKDCRFHDHYERVS